MKLLTTVLTAAPCYCISRARRIQSILPHFYLRFILILLLCEVNLLLNLTGCAMAWMFGCELLTVEARIQTYGIHMGFMLDRIFLWALRFSSESYYFKNFRYLPSSGDGRVPFETTVLKDWLSPISVIKLSNPVTCRSNDTSSLKY
jgi:hypothetical protein